MDKDLLKFLSKDKNKPGAGLVIVRKFNEEWLVLGLKLYDMYDLPKGRIEKKDQSNRFLTAQRECFEECSITITPDDLLWNDEPLCLEHLTIFLAATDQDPIIKQNTNTGIYEHHGAEWLTWDVAAACMYEYLRPAILWAQDKINLQLPEQINIGTSETNI